MQSCWRKLRKPLIFIVLIESVAMLLYLNLREATLLLTSLRDASACENRWRTAGGPVAALRAGAGAVPAAWLRALLL